MSYVKDEADRIAGEQRKNDSDTYIAKKNDAIRIKDQIDAWHAECQALATASTENPGDTDDLNALRAQFHTQIDNVLKVAFT